MSAVRTMTSLAPHLFRGRRGTAQGGIDLLAVAAFAASAALLEAVVGGFRLFWQRQADVPPALAAAADPSMGAAATAAVWTMLAAVASAMLLVPIMTLGGAAARMGALGRDRRLAALRLLGATSADVTWLTTLETMLQAAVGFAAGTLVYLVTLPGWALLTFQGQPLGAGEMLLPPLWIAGIGAGLVVLAGLAGLLGLSAVRISPLGVARSAGRARLRLVRLLGIAVVVGGWLVVAPIVGRLNVALAAVLIVVSLALFQGTINLVGPLLVQLAGTVLRRGRGAVGVLAGRRLLADPKGAWRGVGGLAAVGFAAGAILVMPPAGASASRTTLARILAHDLPAGLLLTLAIALVVAAASTALNQTASVLDRRASLVNLDHLGTPRGVLHRARLLESVVPTVTAALGSTALSTTFFAALLGTSGMAGATASGLLQLAAVLGAGFALVVAASEGCRPVLAATLAGAGARID